MVLEARMPEAGKMASLDIVDGWWRSGADIGEDCYDK